MQQHFVENERSRLTPEQLAAIEALEKANADLEPELLSVSDAKALLKSYARAKKLVDYGIAALSRKIDDRAEVARATGVCLGQATRVVATGKVLGESAELNEALRQGAVSLEQAAEIATAEAAAPGAARDLLPVAQEESFHVLRHQAPGTRLMACGECGGSGTVSFGQGGFAVNRPCPACYGRGQIPAQPCPSCAGTGLVRHERQIRLKVPAGVDTGTKMRLTGQGPRGRAGGSAGDLLITFQVQPHRFFRRKGLDIHVTVPVNIAQAALGSKIRVRTVDNRKVALKIPPGTQSGTRFRVAGQGIEKGGTRGDQYVQVKITVPSRLGEEEERLMKQFAEAAELKY